MNNITKNKWFLFLLGFLLIANITLLLSFFVFGEKQPSTKTPQTPAAGFLSTELGFSEQQKAEHKALKETHLKNIKPLWDEIRKTKDSLYSQINNPSFDDNSLNALTTRLAEKNKLSDEMMFRHFRELRKILTPEQQVKYDTLVPQMMNRKEGWNKGPHPGKK